VARTIGKLVVLLILAFAFPFYYGADGRGILAAIIWSAGMAGGAVITGWRYDDRGSLAKSAVMGFVLASVLIIPAYFLGRWFFA
jgi:hypothetical protein